MTFQNTDIFFLEDLSNLWLSMGKTLKVSFVDVGGWCWWICFHFCCLWWIFKASPNLILFGFHYSQLSETQLHKFSHQTLLLEGWIWDLFPRCANGYTCVFIIFKCGNINIFLTMLLNFINIKHVWSFYFYFYLFFK